MTEAGLPPCRLTRERHADLETLTVGNGVLELTFLPQAGGRLIALRVAGTEVLWRNPRFLDESLRPVRPPASWPGPDGSMASWANVGGSKTWPAPQGWSAADEWPGPPDETFDSGPYETDAWVDEDGAAHVVLTSGADSYTGLRITRAITLPATGNRFVQTNTFRNCATRPVRWSIWEVAQVDAAGGGRVRVETHGPDEPLRLLESVGRLRYERDATGITVPVQDCVGKLGFTAATGLIRWRRADGVEIELSTRRQPDGRYPDGGCPAELWFQCPVPEPLADLGGLQPDAYLVELELLSPLADIAPGECQVLEMEWLCRTP